MATFRLGQKNFLPRAENQKWELSITVTTTSTEILNSTSTLTTKHRNTETVIIVKVQLFGGAINHLANLDIAIVFIVLVIGLIMTFSGVWLSQWLLYLFSAVYGIMVLSYFGNNYSLVNVGTFTISFFPIFTLGFVFLLILLPCILILERP